MVLLLMPRTPFPMVVIGFIINHIDQIYVVGQYLVAHCVLDCKVHLKVN